MQFALEEARTAFNKGEIPVGCVIANESDVIARAHNLCEEMRDPTAHAEILAIRLCAKALGKRRINGLTIYTTLEPCPMCAGAIVLSGLSRLIFAADDKSYGCCGSIYRITEDPAFPGFCRADGGLLKEESQALLDEFFKKIRRD